MFSWRLRSCLWWIFNGYCFRWNTKSYWAPVILEFLGVVRVGSPFVDFVNSRIGGAGVSVGVLHRSCTRTATCFPASEKGCGAVPAGPAEKYRGRSATRISFSTFAMTCAAYVTSHRAQCTRERAPVRAFWPLSGEVVWNWTRIIRMGKISRESLMCIICARFIMMEDWSSRFILS